MRVTHYGNPRVKGKSLPGADSHPTVATSQSVSGVKRAELAAKPVLSEQELMGSISEDVSEPSLPLTSEIRLYTLEPKGKG